MERHPHRSARRSISTAQTLERVVQAVRHARAGRLEALEANLSDLLGRSVTLQVESAPERTSAPAAPAFVVVLPPQIDASFLQPRMATVLGLIVAGQSDKEIADTLGVSYTTARTYVRRLCQCLHVSGRRGIYLWAQQRTQRDRPEPT